MRISDWSSDVCSSDLGGVVGILSAAILVMVCAFSISWIFALMGVLMNTASTVQGVSMLVLFPLTFLSNAFVDPATMPSWLQKFVTVNTVSHLVTAVRALANAGAFGIHVVWRMEESSVGTGGVGTYRSQLWAYT